MTEKGANSNNKEGFKEAIINWKTQMWFIELRGLSESDVITRQKGLKMDFYLKCELEK